MTLSDCIVAIKYLVFPSRLVHGPGIAEYEAAFARHIGVRYAVSFSSGRVGLFGILRSLGIGAGDEVLLQVPTHIVVPDAVRYTGAKPVFVDITLGTYNLDMQYAERVVTPKTKAIIVQHTFGIPADMAAVHAMAQRHSLTVIEDCVHALGSRYAGRPIGSLGKAAFFSTEETKTVSSMMGGMAVTDDPVLAGRLRGFQAECLWPPTLLAARYVAKLVLYHVLGDPKIAPYFYPLYSRLRRVPWVQMAPAPTSDEEQRGLRPKNYEMRLGNAQAVIALRQIRRLDENIAHRKKIAELYRAGLSDRDVMLPDHPREAEPAYLRFPVLAEDRATAISQMAGLVVLGQWFTSVLEESKSPEYGGYRMGSCPVAEYAVRHLINLPTHPRITAADAEQILAWLKTVALQKTEFLRLSQDQGESPKKNQRDDSE